MDDEAKKKKFQHTCTFFHSSISEQKQRSGEGADGEIQYQWGTGTVQPPLGAGHYSHSTAIFLFDPHQMDPLLLLFSLEGFSKFNATSRIGGTVKSKSLQKSDSELTSLP